MRTTLIITVFNEEDTITNLLRSVDSQTILPSELIIVDAGSSDKTLGLIRDFQKNTKLKIKVIVKRGNRSEGRNVAVKNANNEIILCTDAGCTLKKDWVENISRHFKSNDVGAVGGYYVPVAKTDFGKCLSTYTSVMPDQINANNFLPSSRSIAFRKSSWEKVGGYPTWLDTCEDLYFARQMKRKNIKFVFDKNAVVNWPQRKNIKEAFLQFYSYAFGDGVARYFRKNMPFLFGRYILGIFLVVVFIYSRSISLLFLIFALLICYVLWSILKNYKYVQKQSAYFWLPVLQFCADFAVIVGNTLGFIKSFTIKGKT